VVTIIRATHAKDMAPVARSIVASMGVSTFPSGVAVPWPAKSPVRDQPAGRLLEQSQQIAET
jgi:hypothetical protein